MKKSFQIDLLSYFGTSVGVHQLRAPAQGVTMRHAERSYYRSGQQEAILQEFDGRNGYLYSIETTLTSTLEIPIRTEQPDLHILHLMSGAEPVTLLDNNNTPICILASERSCYLYLPAGDYTLRIPAGWNSLFGFYFDGGIFRHGNEQEFPFLEHVLSHYRSQQAQSIASIDFWVGPQTRSAILYLCQNLQRGVLSNEDFISQNLFKLIALSKKKIALQPQTDIKTTYVLAVRERIVQELANGNGIPSLDLIASDIRLSLRHLNRLHQEFYQMSIRKYAKTVIAELAVPMLQSGMCVTEVSNYFNYSNSSAFARMIKTKTGKTPSQWIEERK